MARAPPPLLALQNRNGQSSLARLPTEFPELRAYGMERRKIGGNLDFWGESAPLARPILLALPSDWRLSSTGESHEAEQVKVQIQSKP